MCKRTKGKLEIIDGTILVGSEGRTIATLFYVDMPHKEDIGPKEALDNAARLVKCWNTHDGLLDALREIAILAKRGVEAKGLPSAIAIAFDIENMADNALALEKEASHE